jgi:proton-dependent oligopeptide transporter, POT family
VTKVAPVRFASLLMGVWFLANAVADKLAGSLAALMDSMPSLAAFFSIFIAIAGVAGLLMLFAVPYLERLAPTVD